ncbi:hypothetical protein ROHU_030286 [Labeo rohita]|uniref:Uncharacterized protein n=1 Tax=Labeo rohita TaxID=84645 RepID=A0A498LTY9_LABRO|nr:hypothetical protein ROHU_030286 [Labeo rohita]
MNSGQFSTDVFNCLQMCPDRYFTNKQQPRAAFDKGSGQFQSVSQETHIFSKMGGLNHELRQANYPLLGLEDGRGAISGRRVTGGVRERLETGLSVGGGDASRFLTQERRGRSPVPPFLIALAASAISCRCTGLKTPLSCLFGQRRKCGVPEKHKGGKRGCRHD